MSLEVMNWAWEQPVAKSTNKLVLLALADHANADGECWPSMKRIAERSDISPRQVSRAINELVELGLVEKAARRRYGGQYRGWDYRVLVHRTSTSDGHPRPVTSGHPRPSPADTGVRSEPSENRQVEPLAAAPREPVKKERKTDPLWDTMLQTCGISPQTLTGSERGRINKALKELREVGATPDELRARAKTYTTKYPGAALTPTALSGNWSQLTPPTRNPTTCRDCGQHLDRHDQETCDAFRRR